jgi:hypothetical protein
MANYNTFVLIDCYSKKSLLITSSPKKVFKRMSRGMRIEVWNNNELVEKIYNYNLNNLKPYLKLEEDYIRKKQKKAEMRNKKKRERRYFRERRVN